MLDEHKNDGNDTTSYKVLDIGVGANCIYPIIGAKLFNWQMVGADIHNDAVASAKKIVAATKGLKNNIEIRHQTNNPHQLFQYLNQTQYQNMLIH